MGASLVTTFRAMAHNNAWANFRLLKACAGLTQDEFLAARTSFFPSIALTLNHTLTVDWFYVDALEGGTLGLDAFAQDLPCPLLADLAREQRAIDVRLVAHCDGLTEAALDDIVRIDRRTRVQRERRDRLLLHLFQHQIHHRGQVHAMLAGTNVKPPQLDEFFSIGEASLRAVDFAALGWTEEDIWGAHELRG